MSKNSKPKRIPGEQQLLDSLNSSDTQIGIHRNVAISWSKAALDGEADFYVIVPKFGILTIEAKKAKQVLYKEGKWYLDKNPAPNKNPLEQASRARGALKNYLEELGIETKFPMARLVWFTNLSRYQFDPKSNKDIQFHEWELAWKEDLKDAGETVRRVLTEHAKYYAGSETIGHKPDALTEELADEISRSIYTDFYIEEEPVDMKSVVEKEREKLIGEQLEQLAIVSNNQHIYIEGAAGTGKSFLLAQMAWEQFRAGKRTLLTCWNVMMGEELARKFPTKELNMTVTDLNRLMLDICGLAENPHGADTDWFEIELPKKAAGILKAKPFLGQYSSILIDEFQDIVSKPEVLNFVFHLTAGDSLSHFKLVMAGDKHQQILSEGNIQLEPYGEIKKLVKDTVIISLSKNCRSDPKLYKDMMEYLQMPGLVKDHRLTEINGGGLTVLDVKPQNQQKRLREVLRKLLEKHEAEDIRVLSPFGGRSSLAGRIVHSEAKSNEAKWLKENLKSPEVPDGIRWRSIMKYKGLESEVVVITDLGQEAEEFFEKIGQPYRDAIYVGISRAKSKCIILRAQQT
jgi:hypothetical protein